VSTILLVEDNPLNRHLFRELLARQFKIIEACSAEEAQGILEITTPDLILMDMQQPGIDGLSLVRQIKLSSRLAHIPIIIVSSLALPRYLHDAREAGCVDYITKPITDEPTALINRISRWLSLSAL
jgi:CheY-like chemotaxis protein